MASTVLVITALEDVTADLVIAALNERGVHVARVDPADIGPHLAFAFHLSPGSTVWSGSLRTTSREVRLEEVAAVYFRRPTPYTSRFVHLSVQEREFAVAEARHGLGGVLNGLSGVRYVNHPLAVAHAEFKPRQLRQFTELGLQIPPTLVTNDVDAARNFAELHGHVVYKTFRGLPRGEGGCAGAVWTQRIDAATLDESIAVTAHLFQAEIPKRSDVRVTVVGRRVFAQEIITPDRALDWRRGDWDQLAYGSVAVPPRIEAALQSYLRAFGLVFGCFDFALTGCADEPEAWWAIECNPNGQWGWLPDADAIAGAFADVLTEKGGGQP
ncbi:ATP-grasp ribosomal peptide maturase [Streptomyces sp. 15-116A]|uniref:ATP-grasp ribosomal peptide maturase n=1 Tax=Streptomyces sp. 15-116A TaxID=2259035 RepID=UPI0021B20AB3|nr:ATP-grasp ribosomal peptide maturase [Streptomyces sp. 15-116A]MCT7351343.1 ATP-grasp ribosomal peptide maturase [Streptomyces sp. 15-116A]